MKGKGIPSPRGKTLGDMYVHVNVAIPKNLDEKTLKLFEELQNVEPDPRRETFQNT